MSDYPIESTIEKAVNNQVNSMVGNNDTNLNTIVKMSLMKEMGQISEDEMNDILSKIASANKAEDFYINKEYSLTMDCSGNIIPVLYNEES